MIKGGGTVWISCEESPVYAINYFNKTVYYSEGNTQTFTDGDYSGYLTDGYIFDAAVCVSVQDTKYFCNTANSEFYSVNSVYHNNWNAYQTGAGGVFGMGKASPIWEIIGNPDKKMFDVYMANFNSWTFAEPTYTPTT